MTTSQERSPAVSPATESVTAGGAGSRTSLALGAVALGVAVFGTTAAVVIALLRRQNPSDERSAPVIRGSRNVVISLPFSGITVIQTMHDERGRPRTQLDPQSAVRLLRWWRRAGARAVPSRR